MPAPKSADLSWLPDHFCIRSGWLQITFTAVWLTVLPEILNR
jgi:membrane protein YqaA with SNARE-associated domain